MEMYTACTMPQASVLAVKKVLWSGSERKTRRRFAWTCRKIVLFPDSSSLVFLSEVDLDFFAPAL